MIARLLQSSDGEPLSLYFFFLHSSMYNWQKVFVVEMLQLFTAAYVVM